MVKHVDDVFGVSTSILKDSYVDRGDLDAKISANLRRNYHIAIRGASKTGKSWLRQHVIPDALVVQCRLGKSIEDIYREALGQIGVKLEVSESSTHSLTGTVEGETELGLSLIGRVKAKLGISGSASKTGSSDNLRHNINDLDFICALFSESGKRLVIEDFHYLPQDQRKRFAFDLKAMWDLKLYVVIIGVWSDANLLLHLNSDLSGRVREVSVQWSEEDLREVIDRGSDALNISIDGRIKSELVKISYKNAGILQRIILDTLDEAGIFDRRREVQELNDIQFVHNAAMFYAEELNSVYQTFAHRVSSGVRRRSNSTGIYAHALAVILDSPDKELLDGIPASKIFITANSREPRIQQGNLKTALGNIERLQVDEDGRGLVLSFADDRVRVVDQQLLLYRRFATVQWPWEDMIAQADAEGEEYEPTLPIEWN